MTAMCGTVTYPLLVRIVRSRRFLRLRNFYAIHITIAPFLALIHINIFSFVFTCIRIKLKEAEYADFIAGNPYYNAEIVQQSTEGHGKAYMRVKKKIVEKTYSAPTDYKLI